MRTLLIDKLIQRIDVCCHHGINAALFDSRNGVFCGLRHVSPLCAALARF